jgi:hypothetical protein
MKNNNAMQSCVLIGLCWVSSYVIFRKLLNPQRSEPETMMKRAVNTRVGSQAT